MAAPPQPNWPRRNWPVECRSSRRCWRSRRHASARCNPRARSRSKARGLFARQGPLRFRLPVPGGKPHIAASPSPVDPRARLPPRLRIAIWNAHFSSENPMPSFRLPAALLLGVSLIAASAAAAPDPAKPRYGSWGVDESLMDRSVRPGDDFYAYSIGTWLRNAPIAADKARAGYNYDLPDETERDVRAMIEAAARQPSQPAFVRQIVDFYQAWMNQPGIEARGLAPVRPYLARIAAISSRSALVELMAEPIFAGPVRIGITADDMDPTHYVVTAGQARLGLPSRDYYLLPGPKYVAIRKAYRDYIVRIQQLAGITDAETRADSILALETRLAQD